MPGPRAQARGGDACFKPPKAGAWEKGRLSSTRFPSPRPRACSPEAVERNQAAPPNMWPEPRPHSPRPGTGRDAYHRRFTGEETGSERGGSLPRATQPWRQITEIQTLEEGSPPPPHPPSLLKVLGNQGSDSRLFVSKSVRSGATDSQAQGNPRRAGGHLQGIFLARVVSSRSLWPQFLHLSEAPRIRWWG